MSIPSRHPRGQAPAYETPTLPVCATCRYREANIGPDDRCAIDGRRIRPHTLACESYVTIRRGP